jgi:hypothetical protein
VIMEREGRPGFILQGAPSTFVGIMPRTVGAVRNAVGIVRFGAFFQGTTPIVPFPFRSINERRNERRK